MANYGDAIRTFAHQPPKELASQSVDFFKRFNAEIEGASNDESIDAFPEMINFIHIGGPVIGCRTAKPYTEDYIRELKAMNVRRRGAQREIPSEVDPKGKKVTLGEYPQPVGEHKTTYEYEGDNLQITPGLPKSYTGKVEEVCQGKIVVRKIGRTREDSCQTIMVHDSEKYRVNDTVNVKRTPTRIEVSRTLASVIKGIGSSSVSTTENKDQQAPGKRKKR
jgi:hypothetical protein